MQEWVSNINREMEILRKNKNETLERKYTIRNEECP